MTNEQKERKAARKRAYAKEWYKANRLYRGTYCRIYRKAKKAVSWSQSSMYQDAMNVIVEDREERVKRGKWVDERTGLPYRGICLDYTLD